MVATDLETNITRCRRMHPNCTTITSPTGRLDDNDWVDVKPSNVSLGNVIKYFNGIIKQHTESVNIPILTIVS